LLKQEFADSLKITYLLMLLVAGILTIQSLIVTELTGSLFFGITSLLTTILAWVIFILLSGLDNFTQAEKERVLSFNNRATNFQLGRSMVKLTLFFFFSVLALLLFAIVMYVFPVAGSTITDQITLFFTELQNLPALLSNPWAWFLGIETTVFPYLLYFLSQNNWSSRSLRWDQWVVILAAFEPLTSIFVGIFVGNEAFKYNLLLLILATIIIALTMLLRYYHEKNCVKSIIFLRIKQGQIKGLINRLKYNPNVVEIKTITGQYDVVLRTLFQSNHLLNTFVEKLKELEDTLEVQYFVEFELKK
ncbi:MAG: Lrp/AsnC ligand binding domain-containing protein, partial [Candidatus Helarchaeota archaeon]|nr:Lrp/AsnC ligand binding domain-containing protein [Candidatus Helarchaeota archaeon]